MPVQSFPRLFDSIKTFYDQAATGQEFLERSSILLEQFWRHTTNRPAQAKPGRKPTYKLLIMESLASAPAKYDVNQLVKHAEKELQRLTAEREAAIDAGINRARKREGLVPLQSIKPVSLDLIKRYARIWKLRQVEYTKWTAADWKFMKRFDPDVLSCAAFYGAASPHHDK